MHYAAVDIYPSLNLDGRWALTALGLLVGAVGGYYAARWLRRRLALRAQQRVVEQSKPHADDVIRRALAEIRRIEQEVMAGKLTADAGAAQVSLIARSAFDSLMNHRTAYSARYEVALRHLQSMEQMLTLVYPVAFRPTENHQAFMSVCTSATQVVEACR